MNIASPSLPRTAGPTDRVVIVGAGPAGMATAIELAQRGVPSVVLERRGPTGAREQLFNVVPPMADRLAALDPDGSLTRLLTPTDRMDSMDLQTGRTASRTFEGPLAPDAARSRGNMDALLAAAGPPGAEGADTRRWSMVGIGDVENAMRELARTRHAGLIELRTDAGVESVRQGDGWAEAVLAPGADGAARDTVRGAMLVDATGRDLLGSARTTYPERGFWLGGRFAAPQDGSHATRKVRDRTDTTAHSTIALPSSDRTIVWTQVHEDPTKLDPDLARGLLHARARAVGVLDEMADDDRIMPVTVQLWTSNEPARGRVLKVGDSVRAPYFMTSTGAATALVHDVPKAVDAILAVRDGVPVDEAAAAYADAVTGANERLVSLVRPRLRADLGLDSRVVPSPMAATR